MKILLLVLSSLFTLTVACSSSTSSDTPDPSDASSDAPFESGRNDAMSVVLSYTYGNQITGSTLEILANGTVSGTERTCCPPKIEPTSPNSLSADALNTLLSQIETAAGTQPTVTEKDAGQAGDNSGALIVYAASGARVIIREVSNSRDGAIEKANSSQAATAIRGLVNGYVAVDIE
ncbi:hypothetical protein LVJ94_25405 [Pendulispora rubella]|uniref:Uncharacterized protein n=1 Tax=Pendulispora rubella TaxID=2741070 RepID=A0ABZ2LIH7_9BACT